MRRRAISSGFIPTITESLKVGLLASLCGISLVASAETCPLVNDGDFVRDQSWIGAGAAVNQLSSMEEGLVQSDDKIVMAGWTNKVTGSACPSSQPYACAVIARYTSQGCADSSFGSGGKLGVPISTTKGVKANALARQADGKYVIAGHLGTNLVNNNGIDLFVARITAAGALDTTFNGTGVSSLNIGQEIAYAVAIQSTGKIIAAGSSGSNSLVSRFTTSGALDTNKTSGFGPVSGSKRLGYLSVDNSPAATNDIVNALAIQPDDKIVAVGSYSNGSPTPSMGLMRLTANGALDSTFNGDGNSDGKIFLDLGIPSNGAILRSVAIQPDAKILVGGHFYPTSGGSYRFVARLNSNGALDTTFNAPLGYFMSAHDSTGRAVQVLSDGKILATGIEYSYEASVVRLNADGTPDLTFGPEGQKEHESPPDTLYPFSLGTQSSGDIIVMGWMDGSSIPKQPFMMKFTP